MSDVVKPAINNWIWLADLQQTKDALVVGEYGAHLRMGMEKHFDSIHVHSSPDFEEPNLSFAEQTFDCVVFDIPSGEVLTDNGNGSSVSFLREAKRVLRPGGCAFLPVAHLRRRRPRRVARPLRRAGFREIRSVYVHESFDRPGTLIPATRPAVAFFESWWFGGMRGRVGAAIALAGAHHLIQPSLFFLAYP